MPPPVHLASHDAISDFYLNRTPDTGIFVNCTVAGRTIEELLTLLYSIDGYPTGRPDLLTASKPTPAEIAAMVHNAKNHLAQRVQNSSAAKRVVDEHFSGSDEARRGALCIVLYTMDMPHIPVFRWVNAWLDSTNRRVADVAKHIGPFFVAYNKAAQLLPEVQTKALRAVRNICCSEKLHDAFRNHDTVFAPGRLVNFWSIASFTHSEEVASMVSFCGPPHEDAIVFYCPDMIGRQVELLSAIPDECEVQPHTPSHFRVVASCRVQRKLTVTLKQVFVPDSTYEVHQWDGLLDKIQNDPSSASACADLARKLSNTASVKLRDGSTVTKLSLLLKAVARGSEDPTVFDMLAAEYSDSVYKNKLPNREQMTKRTLCEQAIKYGSQSPDTHFELGRILTGKIFNGAATLPSGRRIGPHDLLVKAIALGRSTAETYEALAASVWSYAKLADGRSMSCNELLTKAVQLGSTNADTYADVANALSAGEVVKLLDGTRLSARALRTKAIFLGSASPSVHIALADSLANHDTVALPCGREVSKWDLYVIAIDLDPTSPVGYRKLALALPASDRPVTLLSGEKVSQRSLYLTAIDLKCREASTYHNLARLLDRDDWVTLADGTQLTSSELFEWAKTPGKRPQ